MKSMFKSRYLFVFVVAVTFSAIMWPSDAHSQRKTCVDCHKDFTDKLKLDFVHEPAKDCEMCHKRHGFAQKLVLVKAMPDLCTDCHENVASEMERANVHAALSEGSCTVCHDPHSSNLAGLMRETEQDMPACMLCHTGMAEVMTDENVHDPVGKADCAACHEPHSSDRPSLLVSDETNVCESCHENALAKHKITGASEFSCGDCHDPHVATKKSPIAGYAHAPFASGDCEDCHTVDDGEVTLEDDFPPDDLCEICHGDETDLISGEASHFGADPMAAGGTSTCLTCHDHHTSSFGDLLTANQSELCTKCHDALEKPDTHRGLFHEPYLRGECSSCHEPHGGGTHTLLISQPNELCVSCHKNIATMMAEGTTSHEAMELVECIECHSAHVAQNMALLKERPEQMCFSCHDRGTFSNQHEPYATANCIACHRNHSTTPGLLVAETNTTCRQCHAPQFKVVNAPFGHPPVQDESCDFCHSPHGSDNRSLLNEPQTVLCFECHDMDELTVVTASTGESEDVQLHQPVAEGNCGGCHDPHGSFIEGLLNREKAELCYNCHTQEKVTFATGNVHEPVADGNCAACHTPHGGTDEALRVLAEPQLCLGCHDFSIPPLEGSHEGFNVTASKCTACHNPHNSPGDHLLNTVTHEPFVDRDCESCHEDGVGAVVQFEADMCLMCHDDKEGGTGHQHTGEVKCIDCHSPHASRFDALLHTPTRLCKGCHSDILQIQVTANSEVTLHKPLENGLCLECHKMHDSPSNRFLAKDQLSLCSGCHESIAARATDASQHDPFKKGKCSSCHATHVAAEAHMLKKEERLLCKSCHRLSTVEMTNAHGGYALSGEHCTTCHDPHSTPKAGSVLVYANLHPPYEDGDCSACHQDDGTVQGGISVCFDCHDSDDFSSVHVAGRSGADLERIDICLDCHSPHAGHENMFRRKTDIETCLQCHDRKEFTRKNVHGALDNGCDTCHDLHQNNYSDLAEPILNELCGDCHEEADTHAHPIGSDYQDPRTGRPLTCASCHEPHSSDHEYMLTFDHQRDLCVQCHTAGTMHVR